MKALLTISVFLTLSNVFGQLTVDKSINFTATDSSKNQVVGHDEPFQLDHAVNVNSAVKSVINFSNSVSYANNIINVNRNIPEQNYQTGMSIAFISNFSCDDSVQITIDGGDTAFITKSITELLDTNNIAVNQYVELIYDGTNFQLLNNTQACPSGFVQVNNNYCIQMNEYGPMTIYDAMAFCDTLGGQLCSLSDWYYACQKTDLNLQDMTNNWEWINHGMDHTSDAATVGNGVCESILTRQSELWQGGNTAIFRCCYYR